MSDWTTFGADLECRCGHSKKQHTAEKGCIATVFEHMKPDRKCKCEKFRNEKQEASNARR